MQKVEIPMLDWQLQAWEHIQNPSIEQVAVLGSRGPGKTWFQQTTAILRALQYPGTNHLLMRRTSDDIVKQYAPAMMLMMQNFHGGRVDYNYNQTYKVFRVFGKGGISYIFLGFAEQIKHAEKHQGFEYATIGFDEVTHFEEDIVKMVRASLRGIGNTKTILTGNPGGIGHAWVRRCYVREQTRDVNTVCLRPMLEDNLFLSKKDPLYESRMIEGLPEWKRRQWVMGDWDATEGSYFQIPEGTLREMDVPHWARWFAGCDWGFSHSAFAVVWIAAWKDRDGNHHCHVARELKRYGLGYKEQAWEALEVESELGKKPRIRYADPATKKREATESADVQHIVAHEWARAGWHTFASKRVGRVPSLMLVREMLKPVYHENGVPYGILTISPHCRFLMQEMEDAVYETRGGIASGEDMQGQDDLIDALRYALVGAYGMEFSQELQEKRKSYSLLRIADA